MAFTGRAAEDVRYVEDVAKKTYTTLKKIAQMKLNVQTVEKTIPLSQDLMTYTKGVGGNTWSKV